METVQTEAALPTAGGPACVQGPARRDRQLRAAAPSPQAPLPHHVHGVFLNYIDHCRPHLFARRDQVVVDSTLSFLPIDGADTDSHYRDWWCVLDHCRGLLLCNIRHGSQLCVCNPATRWWALVPPCWHKGPGWREYYSAYLAFDPAVSTAHYEVVFISSMPEKLQLRPVEPRKPNVERRAPQVCLHGLDDEPFWLDDWLQPSSEVTEEEEEDLLSRSMEMEWPPTPWTLEVFSSKVGRWEERVFVRDGEAVGTLQDVLLDQPRPTWRGPRQRYAAYWQGALYVHCRGSFIVRLSLSNDTYQVIKAPCHHVEKNLPSKPFLGTSVKGVCFGIVDEKCQLRVWILNEPCGQMEWAMQYEVDLKLYAQHVRQRAGQMEAPWKLHDVHDIDTDAAAADSEALPKERFEWDSDSDDFFTVEEEADGSTDGRYSWVSFDILGLHPYKEVVFLVDSFGVVAYHLNTSEAQYLGNSRPRSYYRNYTNDIYESFLYTPCITGDLNGVGNI